MRFFVLNYSKYSNCLPLSSRHASICLIILMKTRSSMACIMSSPQLWYHFFIPSKFLIITESLHCSVMCGVEKHTLYTRILMKQSPYSFKRLHFWKINFDKINNTLSRKKTICWRTTRGHVSPILFWTLFASPIYPLT